MEQILETLKSKYPKERTEKLTVLAQKIFDESSKLKEAEASQKSKAATLATMGDKEFFDMFHGMNMITGSGRGYISAFEYLTRFNGVSLRRVLETCVIVNEKPKMLLMTGRTRTGKGEGRALDPELATLMPKLNEEELAQLASSVIPGDRAGFEARMTYDGDWKYVNFSLVRRIAMMVIENKVRELGVVSPVIGQIYAKYPSGIVSHEFTLENSGGRQSTLDAKLKSQSEVSKAKVFWKEQQWRELFATSL